MLISLKMVLLKAGSHSPLPWVEGGKVWVWVGRTDTRAWTDKWTDGRTDTQTHKAKPIHPCYAGCKKYMALISKQFIKLEYLLL